jgi:PPOX class probable F420-dependent enzyme
MTTFPESHLDLLDAELATLATLGSNGIPQQTVIWFLYEDGQLKTSLNTSRLKTKNLRKRPQCSLLVLDPAVAQRYLEVRGTAALEPDDDYAFARRLGAKYPCTTAPASAAWSSRLRRPTSMPSTYASGRCNSPPGAR